MERKEKTRKPRKKKIKKISNWDNTLTTWLLQQVDCFVRLAAYHKILLHNRANHNVTVDKLRYSEFKHMYPCRQNIPNICPCFFLYFVDAAVIWTHYPHVPWNHVLQFPSTEITPAEEGRTDRLQLLLLLSSDKLFMNSADVLVN